MTTAFKELAGSPEETFAEGGMRATRTFLCAWSERYAFVRDLLGSGYGLGGSSGTNYPGTANVRPTRVQLKAFTDDVVPQTLTTLTDGPNAYVSFAKVTAEYQTVVDKLPGGEEITLAERTWMTYRAAGAAEAVVVTGDNHKWNASDENTNDPDLLVIQRIPVVEHHLMWHNVLLPPKAAIDAEVGKVNSATWHDFAAETMLFDTWDAEKEFALLDDNSEVVTAWKLTYVFRERRVQLPNGGVGGWNHYYRTRPAANMGWDILKNTNGDRPYERTDTFDSLFQYAEVQ